MPAVSYEVLTVSRVAMNFKAISLLHQWLAESTVSDFPLMAPKLKRIDLVGYWSGLFLRRRSFSFDFNLAFDLTLYIPLVAPKLKGVDLVGLIVHSFATDQP